MNAQELRIGNTVKCESYIATVDQLKHDSIVLRDTDGFEVYATYEDISGIPLTYDLLERMGAEQFEDVQRIRINDFFQIEMNMLGGVYIVDNNGFSTGVALIGKYTHCLQNLFFALTGQELTLKPLHP